MLVLFGGKKIPELMRGLGVGVKNFKDGVNGIEAEINKEMDNCPNAPVDKKDDRQQA